MKLPDGVWCAPRAGLENQNGPKVLPPPGRSLFTSHPSRGGVRPARRSPIRVRRSLRSTPCSTRMISTSWILRAAATRFVQRLPDTVPSQSGLRRGRPFPFEVVGGDQFAERPPDVGGDARTIRRSEIGKDVAAT